MRKLKLRRTGPGETYELVDAATGEPIDGVSSLTHCYGMGGVTVSIIIEGIEIERRAEP